MNVLITLFICIEHLRESRICSTLVSLDMVDLLALAAYSNNTDLVWMSAMFFYAS